MKFFIDTGSPADVRAAAAMGVLDGVTTNPSLLAKEGGNNDDVVKQICAIMEEHGGGPVSYEVVSTDTEGMLREGRRLAAMDPNIVVKIPCIKDGIVATKQFSDEGIRTNVTLVFSAPQALIAAKAGATFVSPFVGRLDDIAHDGMALIRDLVSIYDNYGFDTEILVASVRNPIHVVEAAKAGADVCTMPLAVIEQLLKHPLTDNGLAKFLADHAKQKGNA